MTRSRRETVAFLMGGCCIVHIAPAPIAHAARTATIFAMDANQQPERTCNFSGAAADGTRTIRHIECGIVRNEEFAPRHFLLELDLADFNGAFTPGQFANVRCDDTPYGRLYRPFSVMGWDESVRILTIYYRVVGSGTEWLAKQPIGTRLKTLLPLGNSFGIPNNATKVVMVAGGVGVAPLIFLNVQARAEHPDLPISFLMGARTHDGLCLPLFEKYRIDAEFATDDGSSGHYGLVTDLLADTISQGSDFYLACCGPTPMMAAVKRLIPTTVVAEASLEARMACGIGACMGCVAKIEKRRSVDGSFNYATVCHDGPVFPLHRVIFD